PTGAFFALVLALSLPFWPLAALVAWQPLPGLPLSALMAFAPAAAALILVLRREGLAAGRALIASGFDARKIPSPLWWAAAALTMPAVTLASLALSGAPQPWFDAHAVVAPLMLLAFFVAALGEELGWTAYATPPLAERWGPLAAGLAIGLFWALWHVIPFVQGGREWGWIFWQCLKSVAERVLMVQLFFRAGRSVFAVALFHAMSNTAAFATAGGGVLYDPMPTALLLGALALAATAAPERPQAGRFQ
ncbi:MAG: CPBP family intramembrane metalloprotease, partial [Phenylobacterium sp.]|nr:CPBP family intramembrane metalloprotease [Phenylobacterium sp.]